MRRESGIRNMTEGSALRHIVWFTLPLLAGNFLQQFYNMVDSWVVGNYVSDAALAAVGVGFPVIFLFTSLFSGIATGGTVVIAQAFGAGKPERVRHAIDSLYTAFVRSILPITIIALLLVSPLMTVLQVDPAAWVETRTYLLGVCAGLIGNIGYNLNAGILNGVGNSSTTLLFLMVSTVLNILLESKCILFGHPAAQNIEGVGVTMCAGGQFTDVKASRAGFKSGFCGNDRRAVVLEEFLVGCFVGIEACVDLTMSVIQFFESFCGGSMIFIRNKNSLKMHG